MTTTTLLIQTKDLATTQLATTDDAALAQDAIRVKIDKFSFTSNNITYAAFGDAMQYWQFFPTGQAGWGTVPVWGFGTVVQSHHASVPVGERLYGFWPFASHATLLPGKLTPGSWTDCKICAPAPLAVAIRRIAKSRPMFDIYIIRLFV